MPKKDITAHQRTRRWNAGLVAINAAADATDVATALAQHGKKLDLDMAAYNRLRDKSVVHTAILTEKPTGGFVSQIALAAVFEQILYECAAVEYAVDMVNNATVDTIGDILIAYAEMLELDLTDYNALDETKQAQVHAALVGQNFEDGAAIKTAFNAAVAAAQQI